MGRKEDTSKGTGSRWTTESSLQDVIDITSIEELFQQDGPLLAEDSDLYNFETYAAWAKPEPEEADHVKEHMKMVMERMKAREQNGSHRRFYDAASEEREHLMQDAMEALQAAQERMELRARAEAALEAASQRAAAVSSSNTVEEDPQRVAASKRPPVVPGQAALAAAARCEARKALERRQRQALEMAAAARPEPRKVTETLQDRISRVMAETKARTLANQDNTSVNFAEHSEEQTTTASSYSATDSGSESGADLQTGGVFWGPAPR